MTQEQPDAGTAFTPHDHCLCQSHALQVAEERLAARKARLTPVRRRTLEILLEAHRAMGAYEVLERLAEDGFGSQPPVAYRALEFLVQHGLAHRLQRLNAFAACLHPESEHAPAFLICRACDKLAEIPAGCLRNEMNKLSREAGFVVEGVTVEAVGLCASCAEAGSA